LLGTADCLNFGKSDGNLEGNNVGVIKGDTLEDPNGICDEKLVGSKEGNEVGKVLCKILGKKLGWILGI